MRGEGDCSGIDLFCFLFLFLWVVGFVEWYAEEIQ